MIVKQIFFLVVLFFIYCYLKRLSGRVPFYGTSYREIVTRNMKGKIDFTKLEKEKISKESFLISFIIT